MEKYIKVKFIDLLQHCCSMVNWTCYGISEKKIEVQSNQKNVKFILVNIFSILIYFLASECLVTYLGQWTSIHTRVTHDFLITQKYLYNDFFVDCWFNDYLINKNKCVVPHCLPLHTWIFVVVHEYEIRILPYIRS